MPSYCKKMIRRVQLERKFPQKYFGVIKMAGEIADRKSLAIFLVGGPVRDLILKVPNYDLDFVIEGDAISFSESLNKKLRGSLKIYRPFRTSTIDYDGLRIDVATARKEIYKKPAAYPDIEPATIKEDLFRRDFTINAMAIFLNKKAFGELVDFYGGLRDLKKGIIRVMHDRSFIDDPTRIFRAVRFATRYNFRIEQHTKRLMRDAILAGYIGKVNRGRIRKEIELFLNEKDPKKCLDRFANLI